MKRSKQQQDDSIIKNGARFYRRAVIYISPSGELSCCNKRIEWLARAAAQGGWVYNEVLDIMQLSTSHRLPDRTYVQSL